MHTKVQIANRKLGELEIQTCNRMIYSAPASVCPQVLPICNGNTTMSFLFGCLPTANSRKQHRNTFMQRQARIAVCVCVYVWRACRLPSAAAISVLVIHATLPVCWFTGTCLLPLATGQHCNLQLTNCRYSRFKCASLASHAACFAFYCHAVIFAWSLLCGRLTDWCRRCGTFEFRLVGRPANVAA